MRKHKFYIAALAAVMLFSLAACGARTRFKEKSDVVISDTSVHKVELTAEVTGNRKIRITFDNKGGKEYIYGNPYSLEFFSDGSWYKVPFNEDAGIFTMEGIVLGPAEEYAKKDQDGVSVSSTGSMDVALEGMGELPKGHYRIIKQLSLMNDEEGYVEETYFLAAEFDLEKAA